MESSEQPILNQPTSSPRFDIGNTVVYADSEVYPVDWLVFEIWGLFKENSEWYYINPHKFFIKETDVVSTDQYRIILQKYCDSETDIKLVASLVLKGCTATPEQIQEMAMTLNDEAIARAYYHTH